MLSAIGYEIVFVASWQPPPVHAPVAIPVKVGKPSEWPGIVKAVVLAVMLKAPFVPVADIGKENGAVWSVPSSVSAKPKLLTVRPIAATAPVAMTRAAAETE